MVEQFVVKQFRTDGSNGYYDGESLNGPSFNQDLFGSTKFGTYSECTDLLATVLPDGNIYCIQKIYTNNNVPI